MQFLNKVDEIPVVAQRPIVVQTIQKTTDIPQLQCIDKVIDVPVVSVAQAPHVQIVEKTVESPQMQIAEKTVEISQLQAAEKTMLLETGETQTIQGIQTSESLKPDNPDAQNQVPRGRRALRSWWSCLRCKQKPCCQRIGRTELRDGRDVEERISIQTLSEPSDL